MNFTIIQTNLLSKATKIDVIIHYKMNYPLLRTLQAPKPKRQKKFCHTKSNFRSPKIPFAKKVCLPELKMAKKSVCLLGDYKKIFIPGNKPISPLGPQGL